MDIREEIGKELNKRGSDTTGTGGFMRTRVFRMSELIRMIASGKLRFIDGKPFKQWTLPQKSMVIESLLRGLPSDNLVIDGSQDEWYVVEGAEMLSTVNEFRSNKFPLTYLSYSSSKEKPKSYEDLPVRMRSRLRNLEVIATILTPEMTKASRLETYNMALLKIGREDELWKCMEAFYPLQLKLLKEAAKEMNVRIPWIMWQVMVARVLSIQFMSGDCKSTPDLACMEFRLGLTQLITIYETFEDAIKKMGNDAMSDLGATGRMVANIAFGYSLRKLWTREQATVFALSTAIYPYQSLGLTTASYLRKFTDAWRSFEGEGTLYYYRDFVTRTSLIYNYLNDDTQYRTD